jgi:amino acid transporter
MTSSSPARTRDGAAGTLPRVLGPLDAVCMVVGSVIGSGIFLVPGTVARNVPYLGPIVLLWALAGAFSLAGALALAELGAMLPHAGGPYVYLREAYGRVPAFLFGWTEFLVMRSGAVATLAAAFARYFVQIVPTPGGLSPQVWQAAAAVAAIGAVTVVNVLGTALGGRLQVLGTALKVGGVVGLIALPWFLGGADPSRLAPVWPQTFDRSLLSGMAAAMVGILWTYDGWVNLTPLAEEIRDPGRNIPRALFLGMAALVVLYLLMTLSYHLVLPIPEVAAASDDRGAERAVAAVYCGRLMGPGGVWAISLLVMASAFISLNGNMLSGPRAYFAMARDGVFPAGICRVHPIYQTPANAVLAQGAWSIALTCAGTLLVLWPAPIGAGLPTPIVRAWVKLNGTPLYDLLYTYVVFGASLFYMLAIAGVFILRARRPDLPRPYRTWGYPFTPLVYVTGSALLLANMLWETPAESLAGVGIILAGLAAYPFLARRAG